MSGTVSQPDSPDLMASVSAFARVAYQDLLSIVLLSVAFTVTAVPLVTLGASILALVDTMTEIITKENQGAPTRERDRLRYYTQRFRGYLGRGIPFSVLLLVVSGTASYYFVMTASRFSLVYLLGSLIGLYAVVLVTAWVFRAASLMVRSPADEMPSFLTAMQDGAFLAMERPYYTVLQVAALVGVSLALALFPVALPLLLPGLLTLLEVVSFEELTDNGALDIVHAYRGELHDRA